MNNFLDQILAELKNKKEENKPFYLKIKVLPKSTKNEIVEQLEDGTYKIRLTAPATDGKANAELIKFLKKTIGVSEVAIVSGQKDRVKLVKLAG